jgi:hypothetical protein
MPDVTGGALIVTIGLFILLAIAITAGIVLRVRRRDAERATAAIPLLVFPDADKPAGLPARPRQRFVDPRLAPDQPIGPPNWAPATPYEQPSPQPAVGTYAPPVAPSAPAFGAGASSYPAPMPAPPVASPERRGGDVPEQVAARAATPVRRPVAPPTTVNGNGASTEADHPGDGTLQFLPGRLEVIEGQDAGQEIRFVRTGPRTEITFGRSEGPRYKHVQLREQTVSRMHARLSLEGARWRLSNLSQTNPLYVNGAPLDPSHPSVALADGDRIEMGEVVLRFRAH